MDRSNAMHRRRFLNLTGKAILGGSTALTMSRSAFGASPPAETTQSEKPNVIFILTDDQGYGDLACHGNEFIRTPNLDKMHAESPRFTNFHVSPCCSPTRAQIMTGRYPNRTGVWHTVAGRSLMHREEVTMADVFAENGYETGIFGKWHLGDNYPYRPQDRGFKEVLSHGGGGVGNIQDYWANDYFDDTYLHNGEQKEYQGYCSDVWFGEATKFIEANRNRPFFCYIPTNAPHLPFVVPEEYHNLYKRPEIVPGMAEFYGMITNIDDNVAELRKKLVELGIEKNTILIYMTDNGSSRGNAAPVGKYSFNAGMRGGKGSEYEGGHRVPFFIYWPEGGLIRGRDIDQLAAGFDVLPTLMDLCDLERPAGPPLDGISLIPLLKEKADNWPERTLVVDNQRVTYPVKWRRASVMTDQWRLVNGQELYNIKKDPGQKENIARNHPDVVEKLSKSYDRWWESLQGAYHREYEISIGSKYESPTLLTAHDLNGAAVWNHDQILAGKRCDGFWSINVESEGLYEFSLRRWPKEVNASITAGIPVPPELKKLIYDSEDIDYAFTHDEAVALPATHARLKVVDFDESKLIPDGATEVSFQVRLQAGNARLQTWFVQGIDDGDTHGVYYVYVRKL